MGVCTFDENNWLNLRFVFNIFKRNFNLTGLKIKGIQSWLD